MLSAAGFVGFSRAHLDQRIVIARRFTIDEALSPASILGANRTDGVEFGDFFRQTHKGWNGAKGSAPEIEVQSRQNHTHTARGEAPNQFYKRLIKKLTLINSNDRGAFLDAITDLLAIVAGARIKTLPIMGHDAVGRIAGINGGRENLHALFGNLGATCAANQPFRFAAGNAARASTNS